MKYGAELTGLISFGAIFGGVIIGRFVARRLPGHHLSSETQSVATVSVAVIGTLSALVLGLMITAADGSFQPARTKSGSYLFNSSGLIATCCAAG